MASIIDLKYSLPEELWITILKHVSSEDAWNMIREYPHISNAVQPYKALLLFGKVVQFLIDWSAYDDETALLTKPDLFSCRLVCKNWSSEIDLNFHTQNYSLVNAPSFWQSDEVRPYAKISYPWSPSYLDIMFKSLSDFAKFSEKFETLAGNRNPFPSRSCTVYIWYRFACTVGDDEMERLIKNREVEAANEQYWTTLINFLKKFGKHIEHFNLETSFAIYPGHDVNGVFQIKNLAKCLRLLPNLRSILIYASYDKWVFNSIAELETTVASEFLNVPKVEIANFFFLGQKPQLHKSFLTAFSQSIKQLYLFSLEDYCKPPAMPALLDVILCNVCDLERLNYLKLIAQGAPNLCKFTLRVYNPTTQTEDKILQVCAQFPNQKKFKLDFKHVEESVWPIVTLRFVL